jgi:hypothetical protein
MPSITFPALEGADTMNNSQSATEANRVAGSSSAANLRFHFTERHRLTPTDAGRRRTGILSAKRIKLSQLNSTQLNSTQRPQHPL